MEKKTMVIFLIFLVFTLTFFGVLGLLENSSKEKQAKKFMAEKLKNEKKTNKKDSINNNGNNADFKKF